MPDPAFSATPPMHVYGDAEDPELPHVLPAEAERLRAAGADHVLLPYAYAAGEVADLVAGDGAPD